MVQPQWKTAGGLLRDLEAELPYDPAILLTGIYPKKKEKKMVKSGSHRGARTPVSTAAKMCRRPARPSQTDKERTVHRDKEHRAAFKKEVL